jgi:hypothetical protein
MDGVAHGVGAVEALPHRQVAAPVQLARFDLETGGVRDHRDREGFARLLERESHHAGDGAGGADRGEVRIVPAAGGNVHGVHQRHRDVVAERQRHEQRFPADVAPLAGRNDRGKDVAGMTAAAFTDVVVVVVVGAHRRAIDQRCRLRRRLQPRAPNARWAGRGKERGIAPRGLRRRMRERAEGDRERVGDHALRSVLDLFGKFDRVAEREVS